MNAVNAAFETRFGLILEGCCPKGHGALEIRSDYGWCETCHKGWRAGKDSDGALVITMVQIYESIRINGHDGSHFTQGPGTLRWYESGTTATLSAGE